MASLNHVMLIGHLGDNIELRHTATNKAVANFSLATSSKVGDKEQTEWHRIVVWDKTAENCAKFLSKGKLVAIEGRIATRIWEKNGEKRESKEIVASNVVFLSPREEVPNQIQKPVAKDGPDYSDPHWLDSVPF